MTRDHVLENILRDIAPETEDRFCEITWWQNRRANGGLRLSTQAHNFLHQHNAPHWQFELDPTWITPKNMLRMDRLIPVPYSLEISSRPRRCHVTVWDSGQAMTIELLGDFDRILAALERAW